jgi:hypothetical protein
MTTPFIVLDAKQNTESTAAAAIVRFADDSHIGVLNVAGPRLNGWAEGQAFADRVVAALINNCREDRGIIATSITRANSARGR